MFEWCYVDSKVVYWTVSEFVTEGIWKFFMGTILAEEVSALSTWCELALPERFKCE